MIIQKNYRIKVKNKLVQGKEIHKFLIVHWIYLKMKTKNRIAYRKLVLNNRLLKSQINVSNP